MCVTEEEVLRMAGGEDVVYADDEGKRRMLYVPLEQGRRRRYKRKVRKI